MASQVWHDAESAFQAFRPFEELLEVMVPEIAAAVPWTARVNEGTWVRPNLLTGPATLRAAMACCLESRIGAAYPHYLLARVLAEQHQPDGAVHEFELAIKLRPRFADSYLSRGNVYKSLNREEESLKAFTKAAVLAPGNPAAQYQLGSALLRNDQPNAA
jgi:tetratricopeptide (TPR) repeat protein